MWREFPLRNLKFAKLTYSTLASNAASRLLFYFMISKWPLPTLLVPGSGLTVNRERLAGGLCAQENHRWPKFNSWIWAANQDRPPGMSFFSGGAAAGPGSCLRPSTSFPSTGQSGATTSTRGGVSLPLPRPRLSPGKRPRPGPGAGISGDRTLIHIPAGRPSGHEPGPEILTSWPAGVEAPAPAREPNHHHP